VEPFRLRRGRESLPAPPDRRRRPAVVPGGPFAFSSCYPFTDCKATSD